jgi:uncharacterized radical SAM protein YgiQ
MFPDEAKKKGWSKLDVIIVSGDAYVDHPSYGTAVIGRVLERRGYKIGIIAQPYWRMLDDFTRLGRPRLCVCVTAGNVDSMVANYTANKKRRRSDDYTPGGLAGMRPNRASIVYTNRIRTAFKGIPVILGGIEASMRRLAHYDYWDDAVRRSILLDAKADMVIYGMGERPIVEVVDRLNKGEIIGSIRDVRGTVVSVKRSEVPPDTIFLPSFEEVRENHEAFNRAFRLAYEQMNPCHGRMVVQPHADQYVLHLPPALPLTTNDLDTSYDLPYMRACHPSYDALGGVKGFETVRWSITALRGCPGECSFCGLSMHQGRIVQSRSRRSILAEAETLARDPAFKGTITDVGGPTANLYGAECRKWTAHDPCSAKQCLMPSKCPSLELGYAKCLGLYKTIRKIPRVKHLFLASGLRYDLLIGLEAEKYLKEICEHYVSGQMKVAPEHTNDSILELMNKPPYRCYEEFVKKFEKVNARLKNRKYLVNYFISAHPGSRLDDALSCAMTLLSRNMRPEQVQDFIPLPMTVSSCLYHTGAHPVSGKRVFVPRRADERAMQRALLQSQNPQNKPLIKKALRILGKENLLNRFISRRPRVSSKISLN